MSSHVEAELMRRVALLESALVERNATVARLQRDARVSESKVRACDELRAENGALRARVDSLTRREFELERTVERLESKIKDVDAAAAGTGRTNSKAAAAAPAPPPPLPASFKTLSLVTTTPPRLAAGPADAAIAPDSAPAALPSTRAKRSMAALFGPRAPPVGCSTTAALAPPAALAVDTTGASATPSGAVAPPVVAGASAIGAMRPGESDLDRLRRAIQSDLYIPAVPYQPPAAPCRTSAVTCGGGDSDPFVSTALGLTDSSHTAPGAPSGFDPVAADATLAAAAATANTTVTDLGLIQSNVSPGKPAPDDGGYTAFLAGGGATTGPDKATAGGYMHIEQFDDLDAGTEEAEVAAVIGQIMDECATDTREEAAMRERLLSLRRGAGGAA